MSQNKNVSKKMGTKITLNIKNLLTKPNKAKNKTKKTP